jgi:hypothetical protein
VRSKQIVLELLVNRIDVVLYVGGKRCGAKRIPMSGEPDAEWSREIHSAAPEIRTVVQQWGASGARALVLYQSPTQAVDLASLAVKPADAIEAARLESLDAFPHPGAVTICEADQLGSDSTGDPVRQHVLVAVDRDDTCAAIVQCVEDAGLRFESATPRDAALLGFLVSGMLRSGDGLDGQLYLGEHSCFFVVVENGSLVFSRRIRIGLDDVATSLTRPIQSAGREPVQLDIATARRLIHTHGLPGRDDVVDEDLGLHGAQVIPLMQPVLQRLIIELRQSLRFGLSEAQRSRLTISMRGPGASTPRFDEVIAEELGAKVETDVAYKRYAWSEPGCDGSELCDAISDRSRLHHLNLQPALVAAQRTGSRLRRWLWTGAAAAMVVIAIDGFRSNLHLKDTKKQAEALSTQASGREALRATGARLTTVLNAMSELETTINREIGARQSYRAMLHEFSRLTPRSVRLTSIWFDRNDDATIGAVSGYAFNDDQGGGRAQLEPFIERLGESPLFSRVDLGNVAAPGQETP